MAQLPNDVINTPELLQLQAERETAMEDLGAERFRRQLEQQSKYRDLSRSKAGKAMDKFHLQQVVDMFKEFLRKAPRETSVDAEILRAFQRVSQTPLIDLETGEQKVTDKGHPRTFNPWDLEQTALIVLRGMIDVCRMPIISMDDPDNYGKRGGARPTATRLAIQIGSRLEQQVILNQLRKYFPDRPGRAGYITRLLKKNIAERANYAYKAHNTQRVLRESAEYFEQNDLGILATRFRWKPWTTDERHQIGNKLMKLVINGLCMKDGVKYFDYETRGAGEYADHFLGLTEAGEAFFDGLHAKAEETQLFHLPMLCPPLPHTHEAAGGYLNIHLPQVQNLVTGTFNGSLTMSDQHLAYLNNQQAQAFRINGWLAQVMSDFDGAARDARNCGKFIPMPRKDDWVQNIPEELRKVRKGEKGYSKKRKHRERVSREYKDFKELEQKSKETYTQELMEVINLCKEDERFYLPTCSDFRGRSLIRSMIVSYQGSDPHKAILEWADGYEADEDTEFWIKVEMTAHMAGGLDKRPWDERVAAIDLHREQIIESVRDPLGCSWWQSKKNVKKPWLWLAAAREWVRLYVDRDPDRVTHLRVHIDATCSGQQYFAGLLGCRRTAEQVNLVKADSPADVYTNVLRAMWRHLEPRLNSITPLDDKLQPKGQFDPERLAALINADFSDLRPGTKGVVVTGQYGAGAATRIKAFINDNEVAKFTENEGRAIYQSIKVGLDECLPAMDLILSWIQKVTRDSLEKTGRNYIILPSADGSRVRQLYPETTKRRVETEHLGCGSLKKRRQAVLQDATDTTDAGQQVIASPPNLIHCQDGATLVLALYDYDKPFACTHDSIAGRPGKEMWDLADRLRRALYSVFTSTVLRDFVELNGLDWDDYEAPYVGTYDPAEVLVATFPYT